MVIELLTRVRKGFSEESAASAGAGAGAAARADWALDRSPGAIERSVTAGVQTAADSLQFVSEDGRPSNAGRNRIASTLALALAPDPAWPARQFRAHPDFGFYRCLCRTSYAATARLFAVLPSGATLTCSLLVLMLRMCCIVCMGAR